MPIAKIFYVIYVVVQFHPWFKFYFPLFLGEVMHDNEFKTKENKIQTKDKITTYIYIYTTYIHAFFYLW